VDLRHSGGEGELTNHKAEPSSSFWRRHAAEILGMALLALAVHDVFGSHGFLAMRRTQKEIQTLHNDIAGLNQENAKLAGQVKSLKSDPKAIERIAREEMGLARPGEIIFKLPPTDKAAEPANRPAEPAKSR
jgi:cell division protein FtsB